MGSLNSKSIGETPTPSPVVSCTSSMRRPAMSRTSSRKSVVLEAITVAHNSRRTKIQKDMYRCAMYGTAKDVEKVIALGDDICQLDEYGRSTLHYACLAGNLVNTKLLFEKGVEVDIGDMDGYTALHWVSICGSPTMVKFLYECDANLHCRDKEGNTPLHLACKRAQVHTVTMLLRCGANPTLKNLKGQTPAEVIDEECPEALRARVGALLRRIKQQNLQKTNISSNPSANSTMLPKRSFLRSSV
mmetsp:Transcript_25307/g.33024  ORF Transcript_25307/g.33024 Transcript_25307/m.33024 type:complete len:245 (-) Transcript_25307:92-826(-)